MTPRNRAIWADAYRLMEQHEVPPQGDYDQNKAYWDSLNKGIADFCAAHKNDPMSWKLSVAIFEAITEEHRRNMMPKSPAEAQIKDDAAHMLFSQTKWPEQTRMEV